MAIPYNENYDGTMPFSDTTLQVHCSANLDVSWPVPGLPTQKFQAIFTYVSTSNVFVCLNSTPNIPAGDSFSFQQYNEFRPFKKFVSGGDVLHFITPDTAAYIGVSISQVQA